MYKKQQNRSLQDLSTMATIGTANAYYECSSLDELITAIKDIQQQESQLWIIGGGSNTVFRQAQFNKALVRFSSDAHSFEELGNGIVLVSAEAGLRWDRLVELTVSKGLSGIEMMSLIPGDCGAAPIQNIGAYGQQISDTLVKVEVLDLETLTLREVSASDLGLSYRSSKLKNTKDKSLFITKIFLELHTEPSVSEPLYKDIDVYLQENNVQNRTSPNSLRQAVVVVRSAKLPDPNQTPNCGSFFKNPVIPADQKQELVKKYPELNPWTSKIFGKTSQGFWEQEDGSFKVAAGMIMEHAGFANHIDSETGFGTWPTQALCVINPDNRSGEDLDRFTKKVMSKIRADYNIELEVEPEMI